MASLLRQIVAGPRARHPEAGLDLCYVTDFIIATSGPSSTYPQRAYRNPTDELVKFLDYKHGSKWSIWEFRAEGTGYPDSEVYGRIQHFPWPDHHPPPFALVPNIMASMRDWLKGPETEPGRVVVVHCKAGKGRSGTIACSYLISQEGWTVEDALTRFTARRMRSGFGAGISIPSQQRWIRYVDFWSKHGKVYVDRPIEILEIHVWGLRDGVRIAVEGYVDKGRQIKTFHTFSNQERTLMETSRTQSHKSGDERSGENESSSVPGDGYTLSASSSATSQKDEEGTGKAALYRPLKKIVVPNSDINIDVEKRSKATYGFTMVTAVAHVWFNTFFESQLSLLSTQQSQSEPNSSEPSPAQISSQPLQLPLSGVFEIEWDAMDGIRGSAKKGTQALDRISIVWRAADNENTGITQVITQPRTGEPVPESGPAEGSNTLSGKSTEKDKKLGLRAETSNSASVSKASSLKSLDALSPKDDSGSSIDEGVKSHGPDGEEFLSHSNDSTSPEPQNNSSASPASSSSSPPPIVTVTSAESANQKSNTPPAAPKSLAVDNAKGNSPVKDVTGGVQAIDFDKETAVPGSKSPTV